MMFTPGPSEELEEAFVKMKQKRQTAYIVCVWKNPCFDLEIQKDKDTFDEPYLKDFITDINQSKQARYGLIDWNDKIMFLRYVPHESTAKNKMIYSAYYEQMWWRFQGINCRKTFDGDDELTEDALFCKMGYNDRYEKNIWQIRRIIWIGFYKNINVANHDDQHSDVTCLIATLSKDLIKLVLSYATHGAKKFQRYKQFYKYKPTL